MPAICCITPSPVQALYRAKMISIGDTKRHNPVSLLSSGGSARCYLTPLRLLSPLRGECNRRTP
jgi:hypothetical protein